MIHLTHTGVYAGLPFCEVNKEKAIERGDRFIHLPYSGSPKKWAWWKDVCTECKKIYYSE